MDIGINLGALQASNALRRNQLALSKVQESLASGKRINRAGDDAAGAAVASTMDAQVRGMKVASRNASDGISLVQTAEGSMSSIESILQRMRELSVQSSNGTFSTDDRTNLDKEFQELKGEITNISTNTQFNGVDLMSSSAGASVTLAIGDKNQTMTINLQKADTTTLGINSDDVTSSGNATTAITNIDNALKTVNTARAQFGAYQNRLEYTVDNLSTNSTNLSAAKSRIEDADMAEMSSEAAKYKVLSQSSIAMIAQSNQNQQMVLSLLQ